MTHQIFYSGVLGRGTDANIYGAGFLVFLIKETGLANMTKEDIKKK